MRFLFSAIFVLLPSVSINAQQPAPGESVIDVKDIQQCGLITRFPGDIISPNCFTQSTNLLSDRTGVLTRRQGYAKYNGSACPNATAIRGMWPFAAQSGIQYLVMASSSSMYYSAGDGSCSVIPGLSGVLHANAAVECVQTLGYLWCTDGIDPVFATNVTSTQAVTQAPPGNHIGTFRNRVLVSGVPGTGANGSGSQVYLSGELNGLDYTIPAIQLTTSPAIISVNGINDGGLVTCLMGEFQNQYLIGRNNDLWGLSGYDLSDFTLRRVSEQVGCLEPKSVQEVTNVLYWLSKRGLEGFTGTQINRVSYPIDSNIISIIAAAGNLNTQSLSSQADWLTGNLVASGPGAPVSATISPGNVVPSSWSISVAFSSFSWVQSDVDFSTAPPSSFDNFSSGNLSKWVQNTNPGIGNWSAVVVGVSSGMQPNVINGGRNEIDILNSISTGTWSFIYPATTTVYSPLSMHFNIICGGPQFDNGGISPTCGKIMYLQFGDSDFQILYSTNIANTGITHTVVSSIGGLSNGVDHIIKISFSSTNFLTANFDGSIVISSQIPSFFTLSSNTTSGFWGTSRQIIGSVFLPQFYENQVSTAYDTHFSTPLVSIAPVSISSSSSSPITFSVQVATSISGVWGGLSSNQNQGKEFARYHIGYFPPQSLPVATAQSQYTSLIAETTAYYITPCILVSSPTSYGNLLVNAVTNGGSFSFWVSTGATCALATASTAPWVSQIPNSVITVTTATTYIAGRILFSMDVATEVPTLQDITFQWNQGGGRPPTASVQWDDRYLLFYTTNTASGAFNDHAFVYDQNQKWQLWDDEYVGSAAIYNNILYTGDSQATGFIYQQDVGQADNGNSFTMTFQTADFDGGDPSMNKQFSRAYIFLGAPNNGNSTASLSCNYSIDGATTTYSLGSVSLSEAPDSTGYFVAKIPFPVGPPTIGHWLNMTCGYTGNVGPIAVHRIRIVYSNIDWD